jgi:predicted RNA-binding Zn ribbon-like protein
MADLSATARFHVEAAPDKLALVQELLNTAPVGRFPDLLAEVDAAVGWAATVGLDGAAARSVGELRLSEGDLTQLRALRDDLRSLSRGSHDGPLSWAGAAALELGEDGEVELRPSGAGAAYVISKILTVVFEAQQVDTWRRLKTCRNLRCQVAFYDRSRNNSGAWHDVKTCGNQANLRAHRARIREGTS